jgi:hypothetical protein
MSLPIRKFPAILESAFTVGRDRDRKTGTFQERGEVGGDGGFVVHQEDGGLVFHWAASKMGTVYPAIDLCARNEDEHHDELPDIRLDKARPKAILSFRRTPSPLGGVGRKP